ncbi:MAG: hypothetical protein ACMUHB_00545 [Thermoplasmatota archaeon]
MNGNVWLVLSILLLIITIMGAYLTKSELIGALGTGLIVMAVWFTFKGIEEDNDRTRL